MLIFYLPQVKAEFYFDPNSLDLTEEEKNNLDPNTLNNIDAQTFKDQGLTADSVVTNLASYIPDAKIRFDFSNMMLSLDIPQAMIIHTAQGEVPVEEWDDGLNMAFLNYNLSGAESRYKGRTDNSQYLNLRSGINLGGWRLHNYSYYSHSAGTDDTWHSLQTYVEHDVRDLKARVALGQTSTKGLVFDSFDFTGAQLVTDTEMLPQSLRGFAPIIRRIALSNAQVEVRQNGNLIYQTFVPPGEFTINDLYPTSNSGDLQVTIKEQDGRERTFIQPFSSTTNMVREGQFQYAINLGKYRTNSSSASSSEQSFVQAETMYGLRNSTTIYGGLIGAEHYQSALLGIGQSFGNFGAVSFDVTAAKATFANDMSKNGLVYRINYNKELLTTGTHISLSGNYYPTDSYYSFQNANENWYRVSSNDYGSPKNQIQFSLSQNLDEYGGVSLSGYQQSYWSNTTSKMRSLSASYNFAVRAVNFNVSYSQNRSDQYNRGNTDNVFALNMSIPFSSLFGGNSNVFVNYNLSATENKQSNQVASLSGRLLDNNNISYTLSQRYNRNKQYDTTTSGSSATLVYTGSVGQANLGYSVDYGDSRRLNYGVQGAIVAHPYGVTLGQTLSDTGSSALIRVTGTSNVKLINNSFISTDWRGYAIMPYLSQYERNTLMLDTNSLPDDVNVSITNQNVVPTQGVLTFANFDTKKGTRVYLHLSYQGQFVPFGAIVSSPEGDSGIIDEHGDVFMTGVPNRTTLNVKWSESKHCETVFDIDNATNRNGIFIAELQCQ